MNLLKQLVIEKHENQLHKTVQNVKLAIMLDKIPRSELTDIITKKNNRDVSQTK